jgi:hypothetical protein
MSGDNLPIRGVAVITPGTAAPQGRVFIVNCTVAGNVNVTFLNGQSHIIPVAIGYSVFPYSITNVAVSGTTATATYANGM